jgi:uncharacterized membrane protein YbhN (UPF0104 family)
MEFLRRRLGLIVRALVSILLIAWLVRKVDWTQLWAIVRTMDVGWLFASFFCFIPVLFIVSWRWRLLMTVHGVRLPFWRIFELNMIGQFFSAFLLGTTGGDVFKIFYAARAVPQRRAAVAFTVIIDRVIGMMAMLFLGVTLSFTQLPLLLSTSGTRLATGTFYFFAAGGAAVAILGTCGPALLRHPFIRSLIKKLPFVHRGTSLFAAYENSARAIGTNLLALVCSVPSHLCILGMGYCILQAMHKAPPLLAFCSILLMVNMLIALPVSISGFGVREGLFIMFFGLLHIDRDHAFAFSLTFFALNLFWSLVGGPFYFLYRHQTHTPPPSTAEVEPIFSET